MNKPAEKFILIILLFALTGCDVLPEEEITYDYPTITNIEIAEIPDEVWDEFSYPDIYLTLIDTLDNVYYTSDVIYNVSEFPIAYEPEDLELLDDERELYIQVWDYDDIDSDSMGTVGPFSAQMMMDDSTEVLTLENYTWTLKVSVTLKW